MTKRRSNKPVEIYTDGSVRGSEGGYGLIMIFGITNKRISSKRYLETTSERMELKAVIRALEELSPGFDVYIYSDYKIMVDIINRSLSYWVEIGDLDGKTNSDLWRRFLRQKRRHTDGGSNLLFTWIRSHSGVKNNEVADKLAMKARKSNKKIICKHNN